MCLNTLNNCKLSDFVIAVFIFDIFSMLLCSMTHVSYKTRVSSITNVFILPVFRHSIDVYFSFKFIKQFMFIFSIFILTYLAVRSGFTKRASASLFVSAIERARAFTALPHAQSRWACGNECLSFDVLYKPNAVLRIHFVGIDKRQSNISFELFDLICYWIVSYEI